MSNLTDQLLGIIARSHWEGTPVTREDAERAVVVARTIDNIKPNAEAFKMTEKQVQRLELWTREAEKRGVSPSYVYKAWTNHAGRPERGYDFTFWYGDGDGTVTGGIDIYGNGWCNYLILSDGEWRDIDFIVNHKFKPLEGDHADDEDYCIYRSMELDQDCGRPEEDHSKDV